MELTGVGGMPLSTEVESLQQSGCDDPNRPKPSTSAIRMSRLRKRRQNHIRIVGIEVTATDCAYLRARGFLVGGETAAQHLSAAIRRPLQSIR